jgi:hypothetical protein
MSPAAFSRRTREIASSSFPLNFLKAKTRTRSEPPLPVVPDAFALFALFGAIVEFALLAFAAAAFRSKLSQAVRND